MTSVDRPRAGWDFFVSYTQADRAWAEWIAWTLEEDGHRVLVQAWDLVAGTNWIEGMHAGTRDASRMIAVLSPDYLESACGTAEWQAAWAAVAVSHASIPRRFASATILDFGRVTAQHRHQRVALPAAKQ